MYFSKKSSDSPKSKAHSASNLFHSPPFHFNCTQSILKVFQDEFNVSDLTIKQSAVLGGGRAENGYCGAFYAGLNLLEGSPELKEEFTNRFREKVGYLTCREIRSSRNLPCRKLVALTAEILEEICCFEHIN